MFAARAGQAGSARQMEVQRKLTILWKAQYSPALPVAKWVRTRQEATSQGSGLTPGDLLC